MKMMLDRLVDNSWQCIDNYRPEWLTNPETGMPLELDRYYTLGERQVAFEFQGDQHYSDLIQKKRDATKIQLCKKHGVIMEWVGAFDLTWKQMTAKVRGSLGRCNMCCNSEIEAKTERYRKTIRRLGGASADQKASKLMRRRGAKRHRTAKELTYRLARRVINCALNIA